MTVKLATIPRSPVKSKETPPVDPSGKVKPLVSIDGKTYSGKVLFYNNKHEQGAPGYGTIDRPFPKKDLFVTSLLKEAKIPNGGLKEGQTVTYQIGKTVEGTLVAINVKVIDTPKRPSWDLYDKR